MWLSMPDRTKTGHKYLERARSRVTRYDVRIEDGIVYLVADERISVGPAEDVVELVGSEVYEVEYDAEVAETYAWTDTDDDHVLRFDVVDTIESMDFPADFAAQVAQVEHQAGGEVISDRTEFFVDMMTSIWDSKGNLDAGG